MAVGIGDVVPRARTGFSLRGWGGGLVSGCGHRGGDLRMWSWKRPGKGRGRGGGWREIDLAYREEQLLHLEGIFEEM